MSQSCPTHTGVREMFDPDAKPKITAYTIDSALIVAAVFDVAGVRMAAGSQNVNDVAPHTARAPIMQLKRPNLSANKPGTHRPRQLPALKMAISWYEKACDMAPLDDAKVVKYVMGTNRAHSIKKMAIVSNRYDLSRKMRKSGRTDCPGLGGSRDLMRRQAMMQQNTSMNAMIRVAHAKPTLGNNCCRANGKMTPPSEPPAAAMPVALPRFTRKKWLAAAKAGVKIRLEPMPPSTPNTRKKCQYWVQVPRRNMERHNKMLPASTKSRGPCASKMGPIWSPQKKARKIYMENIQEIVLSL